MRIVPGFLIREIAGETIAIPTGEAARHLSGLIALNGSGEFLFRLLQAEQTEDSLLQAFMDSYEVDRTTAQKDINEFLTMLRKDDLLTD